MLNFFRQKGLTSAIYGVIIVATILVFVVGFNPTAGKKISGLREDCAARVHGTCIEPKAHRAAFKLVFSRGTGGMRQQVASKIILEGLIERELLAEEAQRLGLTVSEEEITDTIFHGNIHLSLPADNASLGQNLGIEDGRVHVPYFNDPKTKAFDLKAYEKNVKQLTGRSPAEFREWQSREILASKMRDLVRAPIRVADDEAYELYSQQKTTSTVGYAVIRRAWLERYGFSSEQKDIDAWAKDKKNLAGVKTDVRHILVSYKERGGPEPTPEVKAEKKKKADEIYARIKKGEDFAKLAKEFSDDPGSKDNGGQYKADMVPQFHEKFRETYDKLAPGEVSDGPIEIEAFGYHIIKKDEASKDDIAKAFKASKSGDLAKKMADAIRDDIKGGQKPEDAVSAEAEKFAVIKVVTPPKDDKKKDAKATGDAGVDSGVTAAADAGPPPPPMTAAQDPERPQWLGSSPFNRGGTPIPAISSEATGDVLKFAFTSKVGDVADPIATTDGFLVVTLKEQKPATKEEFAKDRDAFVQGLLAVKQNEALAHYVRRLREAAKEDVKIDENNVFGAKSDAGPSGDEDEGM